jgi:hypothetical protein
MTSFAKPNVPSNVLRISVARSEAEALRIATILSRHLPAALIFLVISKAIYPHNS